MARLETTFCGLKLKSPFIFTSGPLIYGLDGMLRAHQAGAGAVVTKTLRLERALNPVSHMSAVDRTSLINCEKWADMDAEEWFKRDIPEAVKAGVTVIASVGHTPPEADALVEKCEKAGAHAIELVSYTEETLLPMLKISLAKVKIPVICKISANWPDPAGTARRCLELGAAGVCCIDSIGPTLKIDIKNRRPVMGSEDGYGWLTGSPIKPVALRVCADTTRKGKVNGNVPQVYASGGVMKADDAMEFLMVGCQAVGLCTACIINGVDYCKKLCASLEKLLDELGFAALEDAIGVALPNFPTRAQEPTKGEQEAGVESDAKYAFGFKAEACTKCRRCVTVCCYAARGLDDKGMHVDRDLCRNCGVCLSVCPTGALSGLIVSSFAEAPEALRSDPQNTVGLFS